MRTRLLALSCLLSLPASAQSPVVYDITFENATHHEAVVTATFSDLPSAAAQLRMSRSSPGRYALHEFAKNVYSVTATDSRGRPLDVTRVNPHQWSVSGHDGTVTVRYTLYADRADGTYSGIDLTHAHLNMPATFMFARGTEARPIRVTFHWTNPAWRVATQLAPTADTTSTHATFTAPHLQYFFDSPTEISEHALYAWRDSLGGPAQTIRFALHHAGTKAEADAYVERVKGIVSELAAFFGEFPRFDFGTYTFLADYLPWDSGDGMEHRNSTVVSSTGSLARSANQLLGTVSHEFTHAWNVERARPGTLEPFDFERENMSNELWLAEGFTNYIGQLILRRTGIYDDRTFAAVEGRGANAVMNNPGRRFFSPVGMSQQAPFVDAASSIDPQNKQNTFISYYTYGQALALALDLTMRTRGDLTLEDFMRGMWAEFGRNQENYAPVRTYTVDDARRVLGKVTGDQAFADDFFRRYVTGQESPDFAPLFAAAGFRMQPPDSSTAWLGATIRVSEGAAELRGNTLIGTPLYEAGLDRGDRIVSLDGRAIDSQAALDSVIDAHRPGDTIPVVFESRGMTRSARITFSVDPSRDVVPFEAVGEALTPSVRAFRARWLDSRVAH